MPFIFATGINGPDGIAVEPATSNGPGRIWVAANQSDEIVIIDGDSNSATQGRAIDKMGDFGGFTGRVGARTGWVGLLFPASVAFSNEGGNFAGTLYVSNTPAFQQIACNPPGPTCGPSSIDSAWAAVASPDTNPRSTVVKFERITGFTPLAFP
jgi:hypothetical protein